MKRLILAIPLHLFMLFSIKYAYSQGHINPEAKKLNDSAYRIWRDFPFPAQKVSQKNDGKPIELSFDSFKHPSFKIDSEGTYKKLMSLLDQALKIDSNYWVAYWSKFSYQSQWKKYTESVVTGEKLLSFFPNEPMIKLALGEQYDGLKDTVAAKKYYNDALAIFNKELDTMNFNNRNRRSTELDKAEVLILLNQNKNAQTFLKELYDKETDDLNKRTIKATMKRTREEILTSKALDITDN